MTTPAQTLIANIGTNEGLLSCARCPALRYQFKQLRQKYPDYWNKPVPGTGPTLSPLLIVGLAPGLHGANRTGVPFEGDASGHLLHATLQHLNLTGRVRITNVLKCLPRQNKPSGAELTRCKPYFEQEMQDFIETKGRAIFALGRVAHERTLAVLGCKQRDHTFAHGAVHVFANGLTLVDSYHCSRYNTQTGRLTAEMFGDAMRQAASIAGFTEAQP